MNPDNFKNKKRLHTPSLAELAAEKKQKTRHEEMSAVSISAMVMNLQQLRVEVKKLLDVLSEMFPNVCRHLRDAGFVPHHPEEGEFTLEELRELQTNQQLSPELQTMLDQYVAVQQQAEMLHEQIKEAEKQIEAFQIRQNEIREEIREAEEQQAELTEQTVEDVHQELSKRITDAPSKEKLKEMFTTDIKAEELNEMPSDLRQMVEHSFHEHHKQNPSIVPTLKPTAVKKAGKEDVLEEDEVEEKQNTDVAQYFLRSLNVINALWQQKKYVPEPEYVGLRAIASNLVYAELQLKAFAAIVDAATQRLSDLNTMQNNLFQRITHMQDQYRGVELSMNNLEHLLEDRGYRMTPGSSYRF